ncbi:MAG: hypothetical protein AAFS10_03250, partial [Myxococcota bacterium]
MLWCVGCGNDSATQPAVSSQDTGTLIDVSDQVDTSDDPQDSGEDTRNDTEEEDTSPEDEPDAVDPCGCEVGEICISNDTVEDACFPRDCPDEQCDSGFVCV